MEREHEPGDVVGIIADRIQLYVTADHVEQPNSYKSIAYHGGSNDPTGATVTIEGGKTHFRYDGDLFVFDRLEYRPNSDYRDDGDPFADGDVKLCHPDGFYPDDGHPLNPLHGPFSLDTFATALANGTLEPATDPDRHTDVAPDGSGPPTVCPDCGGALARGGLALSCTDCDWSSDLEQTAEWLGV